ncbi:MAG: phenylalanine--tRNA ligase subunit beta [Candidatus Cloacimonetes bacterium]|jgi:phenylalanyl-tRNA synthetase beta chain|nr:phenylalanine--tRNA ligase subunit beta [Candidatus Cloacimonadota bacterium]
MKISYNWLKRYVVLKLSPEELKNKMTFAGIEVEAVEELGSELRQIKIAQVVKFEQHPNAEKLSVCQVDVGTETVQVICGAPNCKNNIKVAFAGIGTQIQDFKIKKAKLRGEVSFGMLCSENELGISDDHDGIMILPKDAQIGTDLASYLGINDTCYDVEITPNRPDLLGIIGVARDISALLKLPLTLPESKLNESNEPISNHLSLENKVPELCTRYTARIIKNIEIKESPNWLKKQIISVGLRPINNVVDITNYVMMELGHPLHAFDYSLINGKKIIVRKAKENEEFPALDEVTYKLKIDDIIIADKKRAIALAGVIGGENSHITPKTKDIVIEAANFLYSSIRKTAGRMKISTDSSYRFERDITDENAELASVRACELILEIAGGELLKGKLDSFPTKKELKKVSIRPSRVKKILAIEISSKQIVEYLTALGLNIITETEDNLEFEIPYYRKDLTREIDLIEEVIRINGYNNVPTLTKPQNIMNKPVFYAFRKLEDTLVNYGFSEVINWNFGDPNNLDKFNIKKEDLRRNFAELKNPLGESFSIMRSMLLPGHLKKALYNIHHGQKNIRIFELKKVFTRKDEKLATEKLHLSGILSGELDPAYWKSNTQQIDFHDVKGIMEDIIAELKVENGDFQTSDEPFYQPGMGASIISDETIIASFGKIDPKVAAKYEIDIPLFAFDVDLDAIITMDLFHDQIFENIPKYPPVLRDISIVISKEHKFADIIDTIQKIGKNNISKVVLFDEFAGKNIKDGFHSLTFSLVFSSATKTLTDEYINNILKKVIKSLKNSYNAGMR